METFDGNTTMMKHIRNIFKEHYPFILLLVVYVVFNFYGLTTFPRVGGDEGFLAKLAYLLHQHGLPIINKNLSNVGCEKGFVFFFPTGFLYFSSLALFGKLFGFGLIAMRGHALFFAVCTLLLTYCTALLLFQNKRKAMLAVFLLAISTHFMNLAHMVRQEMMMIATLALVFFCFLQWSFRQKTIFILLASFLCTASVSIHGNGIYYPFFLLGLLGLHHVRRSKVTPQLLVYIFLSFLTGSMVFVMFDYWPYRAEYWNTFHAPIFQGAHLAHYQRLFTHPLREMGASFITLWSRFWDTRLHNLIIYPILYAGTILAGFVIRSRENNFLLFAILMMWLVFLPAHSPIYYMAYALPFYALLLGSILEDVRIKWQRTLSRHAYTIGLAVASFCFLLLMANPITNVWFRRNSDWEATVAEVKQHIDSGSRFIADGAFFFGLDPEKLYDHHPLKCGYDLKTFMMENRIEYFVLNDGTVQIVPAGEGNPLLQCLKETAVPEFQTVLGSKQAPSIVVYNCKDLFFGSKKL